MRPRLALGFHNRPVTHWPVHLIYRLAGSLPYQTVKQLAIARFNLLEQLTVQFPDHATPNHPQAMEYWIAKSEQLCSLQAKYDHQLDLVRQGPTFLHDPRAQQIVLNSWQFIADQQNLELFAVCVMSNHVHVLLQHAQSEGQLELKPLLKNHKRFCARQLKSIGLVDTPRVWPPAFLIATYVRASLQ